MEVERMGWDVMNRPDRLSADNPQVFACLSTGIF